MDKIFEDETLQVVYEAEADKMLDRIRILDRICKDIKTLEGVLKMSPNQAEVRVEVKRSDWAHIPVYIEWNGERIMCSVNGESKPLLESKAWVRWEAGPFLAELLHCCNMEG